MRTIACLAALLLLGACQKKTKEGTGEGVAAKAEVKVPEAEPAAAKVGVASPAPKPTAEATAKDEKPSPPSLADRLGPVLGDKLGAFVAEAGIRSTTGLGGAPAIYRKYRNDSGQRLKVAIMDIQGSSSLRYAIKVSSSLKINKPGHIVKRIRFSGRSAQLTWEKDIAYNGLQLVVADRYQLVVQLDGALDSKNVLKIAKQLDIKRFAALAAADREGAGEK